MSTKTKSREKKMEPSYELTYAVNRLVDRIDRYYDMAVKASQEERYLGSDDYHLNHCTQDFETSQEILRIFLGEPSLVTQAAMEAAWRRLPWAILKDIKCALWLIARKGLEGEELRERAGHTHEDTAQFLDIDIHTYWEWYRSGPPPEELSRVLALAKSLGVEAVFEAEIDAEIAAGQPISLPEPWATLAKKHGGPLRLASGLLGVSLARLIRYATGQVMVEDYYQRRLTEAFAEAGLAVPEGLFRGCPKTFFPPEGEPS